MSGGARGVDTWAAEVARQRGLAVIEHLPELPEAGSPQWAFAKSYYARNQKIVDDSDSIIAFPAPNRRGGTEDTIRRALRAGKPVELR